jgi:disulfide bond formation protein DsbB
MEDHTLLAASLNHNLSILTIIGGVVVALFVAYLVYVVTTKKHSKLVASVGAWVFPLGFFVALGGLFLTLFYSQYLGYAPCELCWYQRVFLYPQVFLFGYAWYKNDRAVLPYTLLLSVIGGLIALYHHALQMGYDLMKPCSSAPFAVDCAKPSFIEFGFVSFPFMAVVLFLSLGVVAVSGMYSKNK